MAVILLVKNKSTKIVVSYFSEIMGILEKKHKNRHPSILS